MGTGNFLPAAQNEDRYYQMVYVDVEPAFEEFMQAIKTIGFKSLDWNFEDRDDEYVLARNRMIEITLGNNADCTVALVISELPPNEYDEMYGYRVYNRQHALRVRHVNLAATHIFNALHKMGYSMRQRRGPYGSITVIAPYTHTNAH